MPIAWQYTAQRRLLSSAMVDMENLISLCPRTCKSEILKLLEKLLHCVVLLFFHFELSTNFPIKCPVRLPECNTLTCASNFSTSFRRQMSLRSWTIFDWFSMQLPANFRPNFRSTFRRTWWSIFELDFRQLSQLIDLHFWGPSMMAFLGQG